MFLNLSRAWKLIIPLHWRTSADLFLQNATLDANLNTGDFAATWIHSCLWTVMQVVRTATPAVLKKEATLQRKVTSLS